jgi:hypothetical protein
MRFLQRQLGDLKKMLVVGVIEVNKKALKDKTMKDRHYSRI